MTENDYQAKLEELHSGTIKELVIKPEEFMDFQNVFQTYQYRSQIEGDAKHGGEIHYHLIEKQSAS
ncbi:hypothetical protein [uncultured Limosilactobacillus sp.]|uniref:hypothetical protein n=1 Tax=uncultured Limosilactobacillus sp. TaxID=2837629 RepID=UPI0025CFF42B|nr:hypothetical protein [uncultured Limosilactobacillus sp.]